MASTPHISLRVYPEKLEKWQACCAQNGTNVSTQVRLLMDAWVRIEEAKQRDEDAQIRVMMDLLDSMES